MVVRELAAAAVVCCAVLSAHAGYELIWSDEFDGPAINADNWTHEVFPGVESGNFELEYYTDRPVNSFIEDGCLMIQAQKENYKDHEYTSGRLRTKGKQEFLYGKIEARIKLPSGQGMWPAFWLLPGDKSPYGTWAAGGEIDIVEATNIPNDVFGTLHFGGPWPQNVFQGARYAGPADAPVADFSKDFHVYTLEWQPYEMRWYVDGNLYSTQHEWYTTAAPYPAPFDKPFFIILNVAVGGRLPGAPDETTQWPQRMLVDWVRVYQTDNKPPELDVRSPEAGARVPAEEPVVIEAKATDPDGEGVRIEIFNGDTLLTTLNNGAVGYRWNVPDGLYTLYIRAVDAEGFVRAETREIVKGQGIPRQPYEGTRAKVPGTIEAEDFDEGMPSDAFHDNDKMNHGNEYRKDQPVDIQTCSEGGFNLGWVEDGEWLTYSVDVAESGDYIPSLRVASPDGAGRFRIEMIGGSLSGPIAPVRTGDWQKYETVEGPPIRLERGEQVLRLVIEKGGANVTSFALRPAKP